MIINDLPPEILSEIFLLSYDEDCTIPLGKRRYVRAMNPKWVPLSLIHVCRYWRETALSLHSLWTHLCGDNLTPTAIEQWLKLSHPAHVHFALFPPGYDDATLDISVVVRAKQMLQLFAQNSDRWGSLTFGTFHPKIAQEFVNIIRDNASSSPIRDLGINLPDRATTISMVNSLITSIPSIHSLHELTWIVPSSGIPRTFPWHTLENVYLKANFQLDEAIWCLSRCISATKVALASIASPNQAPMATSQYNHSTLPNLKSLTLNNNCNPWTLLQYFTFPSLSSLELLTLQACPPLLEELLDRSQCPLLNLRVGARYSDITNADIVACLLTPYLRTVDAVRVYVWDADRKYREIIQQQPDIMLKLPRFEVTNNIYLGWVGRPRSVVSL